jgi:hypothetical protein
MRQRFELDDQTTTGACAHAQQRRGPRGCERVSAGRRGVLTAGGEVAPSTAAAAVVSSRAGGSLGSARLRSARLGSARCRLACAGAAPAGRGQPGKAAGGWRVLWQRRRQHARAARETAAGVRLGRGGAARPPGPAGGVARRRCLKTESVRAVRSRREKRAGGVPPPPPRRASHAVGSGGAAPHRRDGLAFCSAASPAAGHAHRRRAPRRPAAR